MLCTHMLRFYYTVFYNNLILSLFTLYNIIITQMLNKQKQNKKSNIFIQMTMQPLATLVYV
jgi:hypothetical protein